MQNIRQELDRILQRWSAKTALIGAVIFLALSPLDFYSNRTSAPRFFGYRILAAAVLTASALILRRTRRPATTRLLVFGSVLVSAGVLEAMILELGGHDSPYLMGVVLLWVVVAGLIPFSAGFAAFLGGTIFTVYLAPILLWDTVIDEPYFIVSSFLFLCVLVAGVMVRWFHWRHLVGEIGLRHELMQSRERLRGEIALRTGTEASLRDNWEFLSSITSAVMDAIVIIDPEGTVRYWNPAAVRIFGYSAAEAVGRGPFTFLVAPERADALLADYRTWQAAESSLSCGQRVATKGRRKSGETFPMEIAMSAVPRGNRLWACALMTDTSERTRNEERLSLFAAAVEGAADGIFIVGLDGRIMFCNKRGAEIWGGLPTDLVGRNIRQMQSQAVLEKVILPALHSRGSWSGEIAGNTRSGPSIPIWLTASLVRDPEGKPIAMVGLIRDLTGQRQLEAEHVRAQKLESIGVLAGGLAHDFNNLLTIILGNLDLARLFAKDNPDVADVLGHAAEASLRAGDLTRQLITFSKGGRPVMRVGDIADLIRETALFVTAGSSIACELDLPDNLPPVKFDEGQMRQVVHNLVQNAREAMPDGGRLRIVCRAATLAAQEVSTLPEGHYLCLQFIDEGTGIPGEHLPHIFDPYFSTKEMDNTKGRGLGLAVSYSIIHSHQGAILADSPSRGGARISIYLPEAVPSKETGGGSEEAAGQSESEEDIASEDQEIQPEHPGRGRVLVMDDEPLLLNMAGAALRRLGWAATLCRSGAEAIVRYQIALEGGRRFDAVILDLTVPGGLGGLETFKRLREIDPGVRAALSSGYADHPAASDWRASGFAGFIAKPYSLATLEEFLGDLR